MSIIIGKGLNNNIIVSFPYSVERVNKIKQIEGNKFNNNIIAGIFLTQGSLIIS